MDYIFDSDYQYCAYMDAQAAAIQPRLHYCLYTLMLAASFTRLYLWITGQSKER